MLAATRERERDSAAAARAAELRAVALAQELRTIYAETIDLRSRWSGARGSAEPVVSEEVTELRHLFGELAQNTSKTPAVVTIVIPAYEKVEYTIRCLRSIAVNWSSTVNPDIVVVDDASPDGHAGRNPDTRSDRNTVERPVCVQQHAVPDGSERICERHDHGRSTRGHLR